MVRGMKEGCSFLLAGVGGQGILLASNVLAEVGLGLGCDVKKSEVHGMAQRGGSVNTHIRWHPERVLSPLVALAEADVLLSFEQAEVLRYAEFLRPGGIAIVNRHRIEPITVTSGGARYPSEADLGVLARITDQVYIVPGNVLAMELGNARVANVVLLGALSTLVEVPLAIWLQAIKARVPPRYLDLNQRAFSAGRQVMQ